MPNDTGPAAALTDAEIEQNYAYRERFERPEGLESMQDLEAILPPEIAEFTPEQFAALISPDAHQLVLDFEIGGQAGYERQYKRPCWPKGASGITIGIGYDLGYYKPPEVDEAWKPRLREADLARLARTIGLKGLAAGDKLSSVKDIVVPWEGAEGVYKITTVPSFAKQTIGAFPGCEKLHPHCFGALFSLVYNRGAALEGDRRREMKNIRQHVQTGRIEQIPNEFRAMKRIWQGAGMAGLLRRRDEEAKLFEKGLVEMSRPAPVSRPDPVDRPPPVDTAVVAANEPSAPPPVAPGHSSELEAVAPNPGGDGDVAHVPEDDYAENVRPPDLELEAAPAPWTAVAWVSDDDKSTEYHHILPADRDLKEVSFTFTAGDLELLIRANSFEPLRDQGRIAFALRGATLEASTGSADDKFAQRDRQALRLKETRPNHKDFMCVIGVYNLQTQLLSGFIANTVPNRNAVNTWFTKQSAGNMLLCGCYRFVVGRHSKNRFPGCLRQDEQYTVLRSKNNRVYDTDDLFDDGAGEWPWDNIHPGFSDSTGSAQFSSLGCQTVRGSCVANTDRHSGEWKMFRQALGLTKPMDGDDGRKFSYILLTGIEAAIAARLRDQGKDSDFAAVNESLGRLRHGSRGDGVTRLQMLLNVKPDGYFSTSTRIALTKLQAERKAVRDGIYSPALDVAWDQFVLRPQPMVVAAAPASASASATMTESVGTEARGGPPNLSTLDALYLELARRSKAAATYPEAIGAAQLPELESHSPESLASLVAYGKVVFSRIERSAHELICGDGGDDLEDRHKIQQALMQASTGGPGQVIGVLAGVFAAYFYLIPPINQIAAKIIVEKVLAPTLADVQRATQPIVPRTCQTWARTLNNRYGVQTARVRVPAVQRA